MIAHMKLVSQMEVWAPFWFPPTVDLTGLRVGACSKPSVAYDPGPFLALATGQEQLVQIAFKALTYYLIIHPIVYVDPPPAGGARLY
jgi:hypothetical protein